MTDSELLKLAARAARYPVRGIAAQMVSYLPDDAPHIVIGNDSGGDSVWNPLTDDAAAFRLASDLHLSIRSSALVNGDRSVMRGHAYAGDIKEAFSGDSAAMYVAARRAIVRAAAEIGQRME